MARITSVSLMIIMALSLLVGLMTVATQPPLSLGHHPISTSNPLFAANKENLNISQTNYKIKKDKGSDISEKYAVYTTPVQNRRTPDCQNFKESWTAAEGVIWVRETQEDCNDKWTWTIDVSSVSDGIVLQFHDVFLRYNCIAQIFTFSTGTDQMVEQRKFTYRGSDYMSFSPLLLKESRVFVMLDAPYTSYKYSFSTLNISYAAHPVSRMPLEVSNRDVPILIPYIYNCSSNTIIPSAFKCNMIKQCLFNEDEEGCDYLKEGCGDGWMPYKNQCLKMEFGPIINFYDRSSCSVSTEQVTFPDVAERICVSKYGGTLASLVDSEGINLVGNALRQTGLHSAVVGIKKVKPASKSSRQLYRFLWQWGNERSPIAYEQQRLQRDGLLDDCATLDAYPGIHLHPLACTAPRTIPDGYVCMRPNPLHSKIRVQTIYNVTFHLPSRQLNQIPNKRCPDGSLVQMFLRCQSAGEEVQEWSPNRFPLFSCSYGLRVHYTLVCNGNDDCADGSDEADCGKPKLQPLRDSTFLCDNGQLVARFYRCNGNTDCFDGSDETNCVSCSKDTVLCSKVGCLNTYYARNIRFCLTQTVRYEETFLLPKTYVVLLDGYGLSYLHEPNEKNTEGMFQCINGNYIPSFLLNNGELDCTFGEDETVPAVNISCPGYYRCQYSGHCLHPKFVCDGLYHCPNKDDELYCNVPCPVNCSCEGYAYSCTAIPELMTTLQARYLDLSGSTIASTYNLQFMEKLIFLNLSSCSLRLVYLQNMSQLQIVDLSLNQLKNLSSFVFEGLTGLKSMNLSGNPLVPVLDLSFGTFIQASGLNSLREVVMTDTDIHHVENRALGLLTQLVSLDIRRNRIVSYGKEIFFGLHALRRLLTDDSKLCCSYFHESLIECIAPFDELSSCSDLLRLNFFRVFLWTFSVLAIIGNAVVLLYRSFASSQTSSAAFRLQVSNLCGADLLMGVYMLIIGIADTHFKGIYVANENSWKHSTACKIAGFLGFLSSEVSALIICLITINRFLVLYFPLKSSLHLTGVSTLVLCGLIWILGIIIAVVPFLADLEFYEQTSICLPLPITRRQFSGQYYSFGIFIVLNFILFIFIGMGQILIYQALKKANKVSSPLRRQQEITIARRLFVVVFTDFCCWFPLGLMGLLATSGIPIPDEVNVWIAIFILPLNSALNPFLYTLNTVLEKWRMDKQKKNSKNMLGNLQAELLRLQPDLAEEVVRVCILSQVVKKEKMLQWLQLRQNSALGSCSSDFSAEKTSSLVLRDPESASQNTKVIV